MMSIIERIEAHLSTQPRIASIGYVLLHESLDELKARQWIPWYNKITWSAANVTHWMPLPELPK